LAIRTLRTDVHCKRCCGLHLASTLDRTVIDALVTGRYAGLRLLILRRTTIRKWPPICSNEAASVQRALIGTLQKGLAPAKRSEIEQRLRRSYATAGKSPMSLEEFVKHYTDNAEATFRSRAATALGGLGSAKAKEALTTALKQPGQRPDVRQAIETALRSPARP
jgi:hypothetical protein